MHRPPSPQCSYNSPPSSFRFDKTNDVWTLIEDTSFEGEPKLQLDTFLLEGESSVIGHMMLERAKEGAEERGAGAGQLHAERMLEQQDKIPVEWRKFYLVFTGTVWRRRGNTLYVPYLYWDGGRWHLYWIWLGNRWRNCRLVRLGK